MLAYLTGMAAMIAIGVLWRRMLSDATSADAARQVLTRAVYLWFLPALVLRMLWQSETNIDTVRIPLLAAVCILLSALFAWLAYRAFPSIRPSSATLGALLLASAFGNFTYIGLPVLSGVFGEQAGIIAIQFDLLASTPLLFTFGVWLAARHGGHLAGMRAAMSEVLRVPALWAALLGLSFALLSVPLPKVVSHALQLLGQAVVPLMLVAVGMALRWQAGWMARLPLLLPVLVAQLVWMPSIAWILASTWHLPLEMLPAIVVEAGMPTMVLGLVVCDRFALDTSIYAEAITVSTLASFLTLPLWLWYLAPGLSLW